MRWFRTAATLLLAGLAGCGSEEDRFALVPVTGTVSLNNKPLADAKVTFMPEPGNKPNTPGVDTTGPEGNYKLMFKQRSGIAPGKYKVTITPSDAPAGGGAVPDAFKDDPAMARLAGESRPARAKPVEIKGEFSAEVGEKGGTFDFAVKATSSGAKKP